MPPSAQREAAAVVPLANLQRWFLRQVTGAPGLGAGLADDSQIETVILPSAQLAAAERLSIYQAMYFTRLREALADDFPGLVALLGDAGFSTLAGEYLCAHPPRSFTLAHAGRELPAFLATHLEHGGVAARDVAAVEWAVAAAFDADPATPLGAAELAAVTGDEWSQVRFLMTGGFAVLRAEVDVHPVLDAVRAGRPVTAPVAGPFFTVVWRKGFTVWRRPIDEPAFVALHALAAGAAIDDALGAALDCFPGDPELLEPQVSEWFSQWLDDGLFAALVVPTPENSSGRR